MNRRQYLGGICVGALGTMAGCTAFLEQQSTRRAPSLVEDRPDAVYVPTHVEGMEMIPPETVDRYSIAVSYSFPHRFWLMDGTDTNQVQIQEDDTLHLMASVWDEETGVVIPSGNASFTVEKDGETVVQKTMWPMLSQNMGFHYGDNVSLDGEGVYDVTVQFGPVATRTTGGFVDAFGNQVSPAMELEYRQEVLDEIRFERLTDRQGDRGAVAPMEMDMLPASQLPASEDLPGRIVGEGTSGDASFVVTMCDEPPAGIDSEGPYLAVSPRTPYNRYPLPFMALSAMIERGGETIFTGPLRDTLDPDLRYHYGTTVDSLEDGDQIRITVDTPPQVSRHEGYETAFIEMDPVEMTLDF